MAPPNGGVRYMLPNSNTENLMNCMSVLGNIYRTPPFGGANLSYYHFTFKMHDDQILDGQRDQENVRILKN